VAARAVWPELPVLALGSALVALPALAALLLGGGVTPLTPLLLAVLCGPPWAALVACTNAIVLEGESGPARLWREVRRHWTDGLRLMAVPGVACALCLADLAVYRARPGTAALRGRALWFSAGAVVTSRPLLAPGVLALGYVSLQLSTAVFASLLLLVPGPLALVVSAGTWSSSAARRHT
jgi:hypothetical protein